MSETETIKGKLIPIEQKESLEETCKAICEEWNISKGSWAESWREVFEDEFYKGEYVVADDKVYRVEQKDASYEDIFEANMNQDGTISFLVQYYNGGCGFSEAVDQAVKNMNKESK